jgi:uncharacterized membrane protein YagU involved in acid resistance
MKQIKLILLLFFLIILSNFIFANPIEFLFSSIDSINIVENYEKYHLGIDFIIYLLIFASILKIYAKEQFGNGAVFGLTVVFSISMILFEHEKKFKLGDFGFIVLIIAIILISLIIYNKISKHSELGHMEKLTSMYIISYLILNEFLREEMFNFKYDYPFIFFVLNILLIVAIIYLAFKFASYIKTK